MTFHSYRGPQAKAFSLVELLVAMAVFLVMATMVIGLTDGAMRVTTQSQKRTGADASARQALDRISADFAHAIMRSDLPFRFEKRDGNDSITFFAAAESYTPGRGISMIGYRVVDHKLQRGAQAVSWDNGAAAGLPFTTAAQAAGNPDYLVIDEDNYEEVSGDVFRLEIAFLMGDGAIAATTGISASGSGSSVFIGSMVPPVGTAAADTIRAVIIGVAGLDSRSRMALPEGAMDDVSGRFPNAVAGTDFAAHWENFLTADGAPLPLPARQSARYYQRYIDLGR